MLQTNLGARTNGAFPMSRNVIQLITVGTIRMKIDVVSFKDNQLFLKGISFEVSSIYYPGLAAVV